MDCYDISKNLLQIENMSFPKFNNVFENMIQNNCGVTVPPNPFFWYPPDPQCYYGLLRYPG